MTNQELITTSLEGMSETEIRKIAAELQKALAESEKSAELRWNWWNASEGRVRELNEKINAIKTMIAVI